jgi:LysM repeat protein
MRAFAAVACVAVLGAGCGGGGGRTAGRTGSSTTTTSVTVPASTTTTIPSITYTVKPGDTLTAIANRFHASVTTLMTRNHLKNADKLALGQRLSIPPPLPLSLVVSPAHGHQGDAFALNLTGAVPSETIIFTIHSPKGTYSGAPHVAAIDGSVNATYQTALTDATGRYNVTAHGNKGTTLNASFIVAKSSLSP